MSAWLMMALVFSISVVLVLNGRWLALKRGYKERKKMDIKELFDSYEELNQIDPIIYKEVIIKLAESIQLDFGLIRPSDKLDDLLERDSWELGEGQEQFENWLLEYAGQLSEFTNVSTVVELVKAIQAHKTKQ